MAIHTTFATFASHDWKWNYTISTTNYTNSGEMIDRGDKAKAKDREGKRKSPDSQCTSMSMPRKKVNHINYSVLYMCSYCLCVFVNTSYFK